MPDYEYGVTIEWLPTNGYPHVTIKAPRSKFLDIAHMLLEDVKIEDLSEEDREALLNVQSSIFGILRRQERQNTAKKRIQGGLLDVADEISDEYLEAISDWIYKTYERKGKA